MANITCPKVLDCPECPGTNAIDNKSAEAPDPFTFLALRFSYRPPPLNFPDDWYDPGSQPRVGDCENPVSQQQADDCALLDSQDNPPQPRPRPPVFLNEAQTCGINCHGGPDFVYTIPAGTFEGRTQAEANILAASYCQQRAFAARVCPPTAETLPATDITGSTATLNGLVNPNGEDTTVQFEWGTTTAYGNVTPPVMIPAGMTGINVSSGLTGLVGGTTYHFRVLASNGMGLALGADMSFDVPTTCPTPGFWDLGVAGQYGVSRMNGYAINAVTNTLNRLANGVQSNSINVARSSSGTQSGFIVTASANFFLPGDVGRFLFWNTAAVTYRVTQYISPTQVAVATSDTIAIQAFDIKAYTAGVGNVTTGRINSNGDIATQEGSSVVLYPVETGLPTVLVVSTLRRITDAGNVFAFNGTMYFKAGGSSATGFGTSTLTASALNGVSHNADYVCNSGGALNAGGHLRVWNDGTTTIIDPTPLPLPPAVGNQNCTPRAMSSLGVVGSTVAGKSPDNPVQTTNYFFITDPTGYSKAYGPPYTKKNSPAVMRDVNDNRVGTGSMLGDDTGLFDVPCVFESNGTLTAIPLLPGTTQGEGSCINSNGVVVGFMQDVTGAVFTAFLYFNGVTHNLSDYIPQSFKDAGYHAELGDLISDDNYVVLRSKIGGVGSYHACVVCIESI